MPKRQFTEEATPGKEYGLPGTERILSERMWSVTYQLQNCLHIET